MAKKNNNKKKQTKKQVYLVPPKPVMSLAYTVKTKIRPRVYKTFFMLNSAEHEIFSANKYENANKSWHFHIY